MKAWVVAFAAWLSLSGCATNTMVLERASMTADLPIPPPAMVPESTPPSSVFGQISLETIRGDFAEVHQDWGAIEERYWGEVPWAGRLQFQFVHGPHLRWVVGGGYSVSGSIWTGPVISVGNSLVRWDMDLILGATYVRANFQGFARIHDVEQSRRFPSETSFRSGPTVWGQWALRVRARSSGPWGELRYLPVFRWGTLESDLAQDVRAAAVASTLGAYGLGWVQEFADGSSVVAGFRNIGIDGDALRPQALLSVQMAFPRWGRETSSSR